MRNRDSAWTTEDEFESIAFLASDTPRPLTRTRNGALRNGTPSKESRIAKVKSWIAHADTRRWGPGVNLIECQRFALSTLQSLGVKE